MDHRSQLSIGHRASLAQDYRRVHNRFPRCVVSRRAMTLATKCNVDSTVLAAGEQAEARRHDVKQRKVCLDDEPDREVHSGR